MKSIWKASILLAAALSSFAHQPCIGDPNTAKNESSRFDNVEFNIKQREIQAKVDYENAKLRCRDSQTTARPKATGCMTGQKPAEKQENLRHFHAGIDLKKKLVDVNATYANNKLVCASKYPHDTYESSGSTDRNNEFATHTKNLMTIQRNQQQPK